MHMADALLSPAVGGTMWAATAGLTVYASRKIKKDLHDRSVPLMGVMGAFIFAAQMINFTIPGTGSSGHLGGGIILAILLGPHASFITMASILTVQSLFFADGGLLALGCNIFNLGFFPSFIVYPFIYRKLTNPDSSTGRVFFSAILSSVIALQLGAFSVVLQTAASGISQLPLKSFLLMMQPIHLAIGLVEGIVSALLVLFVLKARPEILGAHLVSRREPMPLRRIILIFLIAAGVVGGVVSWYASDNPDGLEWALYRVTGQEELESPEKGVHTALETFQEKTAFMPDYQFREKTDGVALTGKAGTSASGFIGGGIILFLVVLSGILVKVFRKKRNDRDPAPDQGW